MDHGWITPRCPIPVFRAGERSNQIMQKDGELRRLTGASGCPLFLLWLSPSLSRENIHGVRYDACYGIYNVFSLPFLPVFLRLPRWEQWIRRRRLVSVPTQTALYSITDTTTTLLKPGCTFRGVVTSDRRTTRLATFLISAHIDHTRAFSPDSVAITRHNEHLLNMEMLRVGKK